MQITEVSEKQLKEIEIKGIMAELISYLEEESRLKTRLVVAIEVKNTPLIAPTQAAVETLRISIEALRRKLTEATSTLERAN